MKGIVFTEFLELVEDEFSPEIADDIIERSELASGGAYTSLGTYDYAEMVELVTQLSALTKRPVADLLRHFGRHLFSRFAAIYPSFFDGVDNAFEFLKGVENHIHVEVRKLYPDAELPTFEYDAAEAGCLVMTYRSNRSLGDLAEGLIQGCIDHYKERIRLEREDLASEPKTCVRFTLTQMEP